jgi:hypothetical protein
MVEFTAAAAKVRHRVGEAAADAPVGKGFGVVAARRTLQTMKKHQQGPALGFRSDLWLLAADRRSLRTRRVEEVHVDEVAIRRVPAFTLVLGGGSCHAPRIQGRPDGLKVAARQPPGRSVFHS